ncbi:10913_t:CDS:2 [Funneliformis mosseae]|uniref:10913_t:CDS:1 n=2 Tax=Funneliformis TaxID=1117308 RepID=A0A9N9BB83_FUNMO|nr:10913_t:CDS:2 [Funneliformis mosseae]
MGAPTKETAAENAATDNSETNKGTDMVTLKTIKSNKTLKRTTVHRIALGDITPNNLGQLKKLNTVLFPVQYSEKFYKDVLEVGEFARFAYFNDCCVGAVCCRKEPLKEVNQGIPSDQAKLYIMTLGVLAPYRNLGIGTKLLEHILQHATLPTQQPKFVEIYLHVQTSNEEALNFYKKYDFEIVATVEGYYKKISPSDAYVLSRKL